MNAIHTAFSLERKGFRLEIDIDIPDRGITALFGHSGSGKTTLLRAMAGLERCKGSMKFRNSLWQDDKRGVFLPAHLRRVGYVFQEASLFPHLKVRENLEFGYKRIRSEERTTDFDEVTAWFGLEKLLNRSPKNLSGGERQRVAIARALLSSPQLLLMDEPLSALDQSSKREIMPYLEEMHRRLSIPVIYVSHTVEEVARLADNIVQLESGRVIAQGPAVELLSSLDHRLVAGEEPGGVIEADVATHDEENHLTRLTLSGGLQLLAPRLPVYVGNRVRVRIPAREVSISLDVQQGTSILNILPSRIIDFADGDPGRVLVQLELEKSDVRLLSRISRYSWNRLGLKVGMQVQAQVKSMGLAH